MTCHSGAKSKGVVIFITIADLPPNKSLVRWASISHILYLSPSLGPKNKMCISGNQTLPNERM